MAMRTMARKYYFDGLLASYVASRLEPEKVKVSGIELEILEKINRSRKLISNTELAKRGGMPLESVGYVVKALDKKNLIEHGSGWRTTEKGKQVIEKAIELYEQSKEIAQADRSFSLLMAASGTKVYY